MQNTFAMSAPKTVIAGVSRKILRMVMLPAIALSIAGGAYVISEGIIARSLREDATTTALAWRGYFSGGSLGLEEVMQSGQLTPQQRDFISAVAKVGRVVSFSLFDSRGRLVFESKTAPKQMSLATHDHDDGAVRAIEYRKAVVQVFKRTTSESIADVYAEAHVPLLTPDGEVLGLVEIHIDQSRTARLFRQAFDGFALSLAGLIAAGLLGISLPSAVRRMSKVEALASQLGNEPPDALVPIANHKIQVDMQAAVAAADCFDNWLARVTEDAAQGIPERIIMECHLGLGDGAVPMNAEKLEQCLRCLVAEAAVALLPHGDAGGNAIVLAPRIVVATRHTPRGIEMQISDNSLYPRLQESASLAGLREHAVAQGGGLEVLHTPGEGMTIIAWWPNALQQAKAA